MTTTVMYETAADLERELRTINRFLAKYPGCTAEKLDRSFHHDFAILSPQGKTVLYVEVKQRFAPRSKFKTYWIGESRLQRMSRVARRDGVHTLLLVEWEDALGHVDPQYALDNAEIKMGGRRDRNDERDLERMAEFSYDLFTFIEEAK